MKGAGNERRIRASGETREYLWSKDSYKEGEWRGGVNGE